MATIFVAVEFVVEHPMALLAHRMRPLLDRIGKSLNRACAGMLLAMGATLPMTR